MWNPFDNQWNENFDLLKKYLKKQKTYPSWENYGLGAWVGMQRRLYRVNGLEHARMYRLESLPGWSWDPLVDNWNKYWFDLKKYFAKHKKYPDQLDGFLGKWTWRQRRRYEKNLMTKDQILKIESLPGWSWNPLVDNWNKNFNLLKKYLAKHKTYPIRGSGSLSEWISGQRKTSR